MFGSQALSSFSAPTKSIQVSQPAVPSGHFPSLAIRPSKRCGRKYGIWYSSLHARTAYTYRGRMRKSSMLVREGGTPVRTHRLSRKSRSLTLKTTAMTM